MKFNVEVTVQDNDLFYLEQTLNPDIPTVEALINWLTQGAISQFLYDAFLDTEKEEEINETTN